MRTIGIIEEDATPEAPEKPEAPETPKNGEKGKGDKTKGAGKPKDGAAGK